MKSIKLALLLISVVPNLYAGTDVNSEPGAYSLLKTYAAVEDLAGLFPEPLAVPQKAYVIPMKSGEELFQYIHTVTETGVQGGGQDYLKAKKYMFSIADNTGCGSGPGVLEFYSQVCVPGSSQHGSDYREITDMNGDGIIDRGGMNAEHSWPQGFFDGAYPMRSDLHHIFPTFITPNNIRGSLPYAMMSNRVLSYSNSCGTRLGPDGFEPCNPVKGNVARAILYFVTRYSDRKIRDQMDYRDFWTNRVGMFLEWNRMDPPDANERRRNDLIQKFQGNRNPFVDDPSLADRIGAAVFASH